MDVSNYKGDGEIIPAGKAGLTKGFFITFDKLDLRKKFSKKYIIIDYPKIKKQYWFGIDIKTENEELSKSLKGILSLRVLNSNREQLIECSAPLDRWRYSMVKMDKYYHLFVYYLDKNKESSFKIDDLRNLNNKDLLLVVKYDPKSTKEKIVGSIQLRVGGFK